MGITSKLKANKDNIREKNYTLFSLINTDEQVLNVHWKTKSSIVQKNIIPNKQVVFITRIQGWFHINQC